MYGLLPVGPHQFWPAWVLIGMTLTQARTWLDADPIRLERVAICGRALSVVSVGVRSQLKPSTIGPMQCRTLAAAKAAGLER
jgi:hypothetical protein